MATEITLKRKGEVVPVKADTVVIALAGPSDNQLAQQLQASGIEHYLAGDCKGLYT